MRNARRLDHRQVIFATVVVTCSACVERCAPGLVGAGVARLSVRNAGAILELVNADEVCGFESNEVKSAVVLDGAIGAEGTATWTVTDCDIDLGDVMQVRSSCDGVETEITGRIRVSATRAIGGTLTGDVDNPVVPGGPDAVTIDVRRAQFEAFRVASSDSDAVLTMKNGIVSFIAKPRLARAASTGVCMLATPHIRISELRYQRAKLHVKTEDRSFDVDVPYSNLWAVNGKHGVSENEINGKITVWQNNVELNPEDGLDPDYDAAKFETGFACTADMQTPVSFECEGVGPMLAQGAARLTVRTFGAVLSALDVNTACGFSSRQVLDDTQVLGDIGGIGSIEATVTDCVLEFEPDTVTETSCTGSDTVAQGRVTVSAVKRVQGRLTGDRTEPVVPISDSPAVMEVTEMRFEGFSVAQDDTALVAETGTLVGRILPRLAVDASRGACSKKTPIARFEGLTWTDAKVSIQSPSGRFETTIESSTLDALNGTWGSDSNLLDGRLTLGGEIYDLPTNPADDGLDPEFEQTKFDDGWQCGDVRLPVSHDCHFVEPLAQGAAQLSIKMLGTIAGAVEANTECGFASAGVKATAVTTGNLGEEGGEATFEIAVPCTLRFPQPTAVETDCHGVTTYLSGTAAVTGTKSIRGFVSGHPDDPTVPNRRDAVTIDLTTRAEGLEVWMEPGGHRLKIHGGQLSGMIHPRLAVDTSRDACALPTPVATFEAVRYADADVTIVSEGKTFGVRVDQSNLTAQNGAKGGVENYLEGSIQIDGEVLNIPVSGDPILDPEYDAAKFEASFACQENLRIARSDADCNVRKTIGEGAARLIVQTLGTVTKMVNEDNDCGFESNLTNPSYVQGRPGQMGLMQWQIGQCELDNAVDREDRPISEDCNDTGTHVSGRLIIDGSRTVRGLREEINILFLSFDSIVPVSRDAVDVELDRVVFDEFKAYEKAANALEPRRALTIHSGTMSAKVQPVLGENEDERGTFDVPTPIAHLRDITLTDANITLLNEGMTFKVRVDEARLEAFNGSYRGQRNSIAGSITVDGETFALGMSDLDPEYDQFEFDRKYACTRDLEEVVPSW